MIKHLLIIAAVFCFATACRKSEKPVSPLPSTPRVIDTSMMILAPSTVWIDSITGTMLDSCNSSMLRFKGNSLQLSELKEGNIVVSGFLPNAPDGFFAKVVSVEHQGDVYTIQLGPATLTDAFEKLKINEHLVAQTEDLADARLTFGFNTPEITLGDAAKLKGSIEFNPVFDFSFDIENFELRDATIGGSVECDMGLNLKVFKKFANLEKESDPIFRLPLKNIYYGPLVFTPELVVRVGVKGSAALTFEFEYQVESMASAHMVYDGEEWSPGTNSHARGSGLQFPDFNAELELRVYVKPTLEIGLWGLPFAKSRVEPKAYLQGKAKVGTDTGCELSAGVSASLGMDLSIFDKKWAKVEFDDLFDLNYIFYTCNCGPLGRVTDIDGNTYDVAKIANKYWMMQNLRVTHYSNGDTIPQIISAAGWSNDGIVTGAWSDNGEGDYGHLYNWYTVVDKRGVCPAGWHVPDSLEWDDMVMAYGDHMNAGTKLKAKEGWGNGNGTNESCFTGLPGGWRTPNYGAYLYQGSYGSWWTTSVDISSLGGERKFERGWNFLLYYDGANVGIGNFSAREGVSVRCVRND